MNKHTTLEQFSFFQDASPEFLALMRRLTKNVTLTPGMLLYRQGDRCKKLVLVKAGDMRVFRTGVSGHEITLFHVQDRQVCLVNMLSIFLDQPAMATAVVEQPTEALVMSAASMRHWISADPAVRNFFLESAATRMIDVMVLAAEMALGRMEQRLGRLLLDRFSDKRGPGKVIATTHEELARELGTVREVISRLLKELERQGAIRVARGQIDLADESALVQLAQAPHRRCKDHTSAA